MRYVTGIEDAVLNFQKQEYPERSTNTILPYWRWLFVESAQRVGTDPMVWMYLKDGAIKAHQGAIAVIAKVKDAQILTGWFVETMAAQSARGTAIGPMIIKKALEDLPANLSLGQTDQMRELQFAMNWQEHTQLESLQLVISPWVSLTKRLPGILARITGSVVYGFQSIRVARHQKTAQLFQSREVEEFSAVYDEIWAEMARDIDCGVVRDSSYLNWKYANRAEFVRLELRLDGKIVGAVIMVIRDDEDEFAYKRGVIVDVIAPLRDETLHSAILWHANNVLIEKQVEVVWHFTSSDYLISAAKNFGFLSRGNQYHFLTAGSELEDTSQAWYLTAGDSDLDTYI